MLNSFIFLPHFKLLASLSQVGTNTAIKKKKKNYEQTMEEGKNVSMT